MERPARFLTFQANCGAAKFEKKRNVSGFLIPSANLLRRYAQTVSSFKSKLKTHLFCVFRSHTYILKSSNNNSVLFVRVISPDESL